jgi:hypothetical protein
MFVVHDEVLYDTICLKFDSTRAPKHVHKQRNELKKWMNHVWSHEWEEACDWVPSKMARIQTLGGYGDQSEWMSGNFFQWGPCKSSWICDGTICHEKWPFLGANSSSLSHMGSGNPIVESRSVFPCFRKSPNQEEFVCRLKSNVLGIMKIMCRVKPLGKGHYENYV